MPDVIALEDSSTDLDEKRNLDGVSHSTEHVLEHEFNRGKKHPLNDEEQDIDSHRKIPRIEDENGEANKELSKADVNGSVSPAAEENGADNDDDEEEDDDYADDDDEEEEYTDKSQEVVDRKGKSVAVDYKGKGKMVVESEDECDDNDDTDDSEDDFPDGSGDDGEDSDELEEDPLAEVDLDNILPSRTRRGGGALRSGVWISGDKDKANDG